MIVGENSKDCRDTVVASINDIAESICALTVRRMSVTIIVILYQVHDLVNRLFNTSLDGIPFDGAVSRYFINDCAFVSPVTSCCLSLLSSVECVSLDLLIVIMSGWSCI